VFLAASRRGLRLAALLLAVLFVVPSFLPVSQVGAVDSPRWINESVWRESSGKVKLFAGPHAYFDAQSHTYQTIDTSIFGNATHYLVDKASYHVYFAKSLAVAWPFTFERNGSLFQWKPVTTGYVEVGTYATQSLRSLNTSAQVEVSGNTITYKQIFGRGVDLRFTVQNKGLKEELLVSPSVISALPSPSVYGMNPGNTFVGMVSSYNTRLNLTNNNIITDNYWSDGRINLKRGGVFQFAFAPSLAWDGQTDVAGQPSNTVRVRNILIKNGGAWKIGSGVPYSWLSSTQGAVVIDPTATIQPANGDDSRILSNTPATNYGTATVLSVGDSLPGRRDRSWIYFNIASAGIPASATITGVEIGLFEYAAGSGGAPPANWAVNVHRLLQTPVELQITWNEYSTGNAWNTAGAGGVGTDRVGTASATITLDATAAGAFVTWSDSNPKAASLSNDVQGIVNGTITDRGWLWEAPTAENGAWGYNFFYSSEFGDATNDPYIEITYTTVQHLNVHVYAANGSTLCSALTACYVTATNSANGSSASLQVSSGWANFTGILSNTNITLTLRAYNTTNSNSPLQVNGSNSVTVNVTGTIDRQIWGSIFQSITLDFDKDDGSGFTPSSFNFTFGNNNTVVTLTTYSGKIFVNGSNTIHRMSWQGNNVKNATTTFAVTSNAQTLQFKGRIYVITRSVLDVNSAAVSTGIQYNITLSNTGNTTALALASSSTFYMQNGSITATIWWRGVLVNGSSSHTVTVAASMSVDAQIGADLSGKTRFAEGTSVNGIESMMIEGISAEYQTSPSSALVNSTTYTVADIAEWNYTSSINLLNLTITGMKTHTNITDISINTLTMQVTFNTTGSGETLYVVAWGGVACAVGSTSRTIHLTNEQTGAVFDTPGYYGVNVTAYYDSYWIVVGQNATSFTVCDEPLLVAQVTYPDGASLSQYFRTFIPSAVVQAMPLPDVRLVSITLFTIQVIDIPEQYADATVRVYVSSQEIASGYLDDGYQFGVYLANGVRFTFNLVGTSTFSDAGLNANPSQTTISITVGSISTYVNAAARSDVISWSALWSGANIVLAYTDTSSTTSSIRFVLYEANQTAKRFVAIYDNTFAAVNATVAIAGNTSRTYFARVETVNSDFGDMVETRGVERSNLGVSMPNLPVAVLGLNLIMPNVTNAWVNLLAMVIVILSAFIFGALYSPFGAIVVAVIGLFFSAIGWLPIAFIDASGALAIAVIAYLAKRRGD